MAFDPDLNIVLFGGQSNEVGVADAVAPTGPTYPHAASMKMIGADGVLKAYSDPYAVNTGALFASPYLNNSGVGVSYAGTLLNDLVEHFGGTWCAVCIAQGGATVKRYAAPRADSNPANCGFWFDTELSNNNQMSPLLYAALQRIRHAKTLGVIRYLVWGQGASDGVLGTPAAEFKTISANLMGILRKEAGNVPIIRLGISDKPSFMDSSFPSNTWNYIKAAIPEYTVSGTTHVSASGIPMQSDGLHYTTSGYVALGARIAAAITGTEVNSLPLLVPGMLCELDSGEAASYTSGGTWANLVDLPADGSTKSSWNIPLGSSTAAPTFECGYTGVAGVPGLACSYFSFDGGDRFLHSSAAASPEFVKRIHRTSETDLEVTFAFDLFFPKGITTGLYYLCGTANAGGATNNGFWFAYDAANARFSFRHYGDASDLTTTNIGTGVYLTRYDGATEIEGQWNTIVFRLTKTSGTDGDISVILNGGTPLTASFTGWGATTQTDPQSAFQISGVGTSSRLPAGARICAFAAWNRAISDTDAETVRAYWNAPPFDLAPTKLQLPITETGSAFAREAFTASNSGGDLLLTYATDKPDGTAIYTRTDGTLPGGLSTSSTFYLLRQSATTAKVSTSKGGSAIAYSTAGSGTHTMIGNSAEIEAVSLPDYQSLYWRTRKGTALVYCPGDGASTSGGVYTRTELRHELDFPKASGDYTLNRTLRVLKTKDDGSRTLTLLQIHSGAQPVLKFSLRNGDIRAYVGIDESGDDGWSVADAPSPYSGTWGPGDRNYDANNISPANLIDEYTTGDTFDVTITFDTDADTLTVSCTYDGDTVAYTYFTDLRTGPFYFKTGGAYWASGTSPASDNAVVVLEGGNGP
ncbi:MAG: hypothetical protein E6R04_06380 [Spirochaetes bacterium]|nr:MAG: hypothetical protein E6R04_06380 [Spirochaetota bacterium]